METRDYAKLIPKSPPKDIVKWLKQTRNYWEYGVLKYKQVSREEADAYTYNYDFFADIRAGADAEKLRPALLYCTECNRYMLAGYIPAKGCHGYGVLSGVQLLDSYWQEGTRFQDGEAMLCPGCGARVKLRSTTSMRYGQTEEHFVVVPTVKKNLLALTEWRIARHFSTQLEESWSFDAFCSYIYDGGRLHRLVNWSCGMMGCYYKLANWEEPKRMVDTLGAPVFYTEDLPSLEGTELENAKLWDYGNYTQSYEIWFKDKLRGTTRAARDIAQWLLSGIGYMRMEDTYDPEVFRLAMFIGPFDVENWMLTHGRATLEFDCQPQRWLKNGQLPVDVQSGQILINAWQPAKPLIQVTGTGDGTLVAGGSTISISNMTGAITLDSETEDAYSGTENLNNNVQVNGGYPILQNGETAVSFSGGITAVQITPRWWSL